MLQRSQLYLAVRAGVHRLGYLARKDETPPAVAEESAEWTAQLARALFARLEEWCRERDVRLVVLSSGFLSYGYPRRDAERAAVDPNLRFLASADSFFAAIDVPWRDLSPQVEAAAGGDMDALIIPLDGHPDEQGARRVAEAAWPHLAPHLAAELAAPR